MLDSRLHGNDEKIWTFYRIVSLSDYNLLLLISPLSRKEFREVNVIRENSVGKLNDEGVEGTLSA
jgi:hypothetical protein